MANSHPRNHHHHHLSNPISITHPAGSLKILQNEFTDLIKDPPEGFVVQPDQTDFFTWHVGIFGPPETLFAGGYFKAVLKFPLDYPYRPPSLRFLTNIWHPNVYPDGRICISILHEPGEDERSGEEASERWSVAQNVRTILLSIISMLNEPNISSPANLDASLEYRKYRENPIKNPTYKEKIDQLIEKSQVLAQNEGISIPRTIEEYTKQFQKKLPVIPSGNHQEYLFDDDEEETEDDDGGVDETRSDQTHSQSNSRMKLVTDSEMKIAIKSTLISSASTDQNNNYYYHSQGDNHSVQQTCVVNQAILFDK